MTRRLSHLDSKGKARMVDVGGKAVTLREAIARARVVVSPGILRLVREGAITKGDVLTVAEIAGVQAAKRTAELIPLCHPLPLSYAGVTLSLDEAAHAIEIEATCRTRASTGVEMEALTAVSIAALTVYDMTKALDRSIEIGEVWLLEKTGGASGDYRRARSGRKS